MLRILLAFSSVIISLAQISPDFQNFLFRKNLDHWDFVRPDLGSAGSFGGRSSPFDVVKKIPVIFIHGNADAALKTSEKFQGWTNTVKLFVEKGYKMAELYATSWGDTDTSAAVLRFHDCFTVKRLRLFVEAVMEYTASSEVNVISHSMGVTLARKVIQGGVLQEIEEGQCDIGRSLMGSIQTFVGISGANRGLCACALFPEMQWPTCNKNNGFFSSETCGMNPRKDCGKTPLDYPCKAETSTLLEDLEKSRTKEARKVYSMWSKDDELLMFGGNVWGEPTSRIPFSDEALILSSLNHMETKDDTAHIQHNWISKD